MRSAKISIIVPILNTAQYLKTAIGSLQNQTLHDIEIICVDNGSSDDSVKIIESLQKADSRIKLIIRPGGRQGHARNEALKITKGEYVGFVDSDDHVDADFFEKLLSNARVFSSEISIGNMVFHDEKSKRNESFWITDVVNSFGYPEPTVVITVADKTRIVNANSSCNKIFSMDFLRKYNIRFPEGLAFEDNLFNLQTTFCASRIAVRNDTFYYYVQRARADSTTDEALRQEHALDIFTIGRMMYDFLQQQPGFSRRGPWMKAYFQYMVLNHYLAMLWRQNIRNRDHFISAIREQLIEISPGRILQLSGWKHVIPLLAIRTIRNGSLLNLILFYRPKEILRRIIRAFKR